MALLAQLKQASMHPVCMLTLQFHYRLLSEGRCLSVPTTWQRLPWKNSADSVIFRQQAQQAAAGGFCVQHAMDSLAEDMAQSPQQTVLTVWLDLQAWHMTHSFRLSQVMLLRRKEDREVENLSRGKKVKKVRLDFGWVMQPPKLVAEEGEAEAPEVQEPEWRCSMLDVQVGVVRHCAFVVEI